MEAPEDRSVTTLYIGGVKPEFGISDDDLRYAVLPHALLLNRLQASLAVAVTRHLSCLVGLSRLARACDFSLVERTLRSMAMWPGSRLPPSRGPRLWSFRGRLRWPPSARFYLPAPHWRPANRREDAERAIEVASHHLSIKGHTLRAMWGRARNSAQASALTAPAAAGDDSLPSLPGLPGLPPGMGLLPPPGRGTCIADYHTHARARTHTHTPLALWGPSPDVAVVPGVGAGLPPGLGVAPPPGLVGAINAAPAVSRGPLYPSMDPSRMGSRVTTGVAPL